MSQRYKQLLQKGKRLRAAGASTGEVLAHLRRQDADLMDAVKIMGNAFGFSLAEANSIVADHPDWVTERDRIIDGGALWAEMEFVSPEAESQFLLVTRDKRMNSERFEFWFDSEETVIRDLAEKRRTEGLLVGIWKRIG